MLAADEGRAPIDAAPAAQTVLLIVENMTCGSCMGRIERALRATPGVAAARASLAVKRVAVTFDEATTEPQKLIEEL
jgi:copper chaperone CopZ